MLACEHGVALAFDVGGAGQFDQQGESLAGDAVLAVVDVKIRGGEGEGVKGGVLTSLVQQIYDSSDTTDFHLKTSDLEINLTKGEK